MHFLLNATTHKTPKCIKGVSQPVRKTSGGDSLHKNNKKSLYGIFLKILCF